MKIVTRGPLTVSCLVLEILLCAVVWCFFKENEFVFCFCVVYWPVDATLIIAILLYLAYRHFFPKKVVAPSPKEILYMKHLRRLGIVVEKPAAKELTVEKIGSVSKRLLLPVIAYFYAENKWFFWLVVIGGAIELILVIAVVVILICQRYYPQKWNMECKNPFDLRFDTMSTTRCMEYN